MNQFWVRLKQNTVNEDVGIWQRACARNARRLGCRAYIEKTLDMMQHLAGVAERLVVENYDYDQMSLDTWLSTQ